MTESMWLAETEDPYRMLNYLGKRVSGRKALLFACASFRHGSSKLTKLEKEILEISERYADGLASEEVLQQAQEESTGKGGIAWLTYTKDFWTAVEAARAAGEWQDEPLQCVLVRDVFGNPFRRLPPPKEKKRWKETLTTWLAWNDSSIPKITQAIYDARAFDRLPILADALEDAGCDNADILAHCRGPGPHVRGCWVVDLLLGKQ